MSPIIHLNVNIHLTWCSFHVMGLNASMFENWIGTHNIYIQKFTKSSRKAYYSMLGPRKGYSGNPRFLRYNYE
jgi:hypothetical protein